jgi:hypothetical protein
LYEPACTFASVASSPTLSDAKDAADRLFDLAIDFPFAGEDHKVAFLAALLTPFARPAIAGPCPLFCFDANSPGCGKSLLADLIAIIATGREMTRTPQTCSDEEAKKAIATVLLEGDRLALIDNATFAVGGGALDAVLTAQTLKDRLLGRMESTGDLPALTIWHVTGNNLAFRGDTARRAVLCRLESREERPEERAGFKYGRLLEHVRAERPRLVVAALTVLRAYYAAGKPQNGLTPFGSFEAWSDVVRGCVVWLTGKDPCATRVHVQGSDPQAEELADVIEGLAELPGSGLGLSAREILRMLDDPNSDSRFERLRDVVVGWGHNGRMPSAVIIGHKLRQMRGRIVGHKFLACHKDRDKYTYWKVSEVQT